MPNIFPHSLNTTTISRTSVKDKIEKRQMVQNILQQPQNAITDDSDDVSDTENTNTIIADSENLSETTSYTKSFEVSKMDASVQCNRRNPYRSIPIQVCPKVNDAATQTDANEESTQIQPQTGSNPDFLGKHLFCLLRKVLLLFQTFCT